MVVKKKTNAEIERFIDKGAAVKAIKDLDFKTILLRIPTIILIELDEELRKKPWLNRTQWIVGTIYEKLMEVSNGGEEYGLPED
jgi:hypothetical protein